MKDSSKKDTEEAFLTLLQRIQRQYNPTTNNHEQPTFTEKPPDEAASALGRQLALTFQKMAQESQGGQVPKGIQEKALVGLANKHVNPSVIQSFFGTLQSMQNNNKKDTFISMQWLPSWIVHAEQVCLDDGGESLEALTCMIRAYAQYLQSSIVSNPQLIANTFRRLQSSAARICFTREFTKMAFVDMERLKELLSPLLAASVLTLQTPTQEALLVLEGIWRESWTEMTKIEDDKFLEILLWMTDALDLFLWGIPCRNLDDRLACKELALRWLIQVLELGSFLAQSGPQPKLASWLVALVSGSLPRLFAIMPSYRISLEPALLQIQSILERLGSKFSLNTVATLRVATLILSSPIKEDVKELLRILAASVQPKKHNTTVHAILRGIGSIFLRDEVCANSSKALIQALVKAKGFDSTDIVSSTTVKVSNVIEFLDESIVNVDNFVTFLSKTSSVEGTRCSSIQQTGALLLGIGLLEDSKNQDAAYAFLKHVMDQYPHLGISLLPVLVDSINTACIRGDGETMLRQLGFLCDAVVKDTQCAREIWNLLGVELMKTTTPSVIRASIIRLFPKICIANKRLYKRVIEALGNNLAQSDSLEIRLAVIATISDLARMDRIRDVTDVIGWIQGFIVDTRMVSTLDKNRSPGNAALVHYAILCLHHLVVAQELDFNLVIVVLNKRLCSVHDMTEVTKLPPLVLESLVLLFGDGERDDDSEDEGDPLQPVGVSVQVSSSISTLINLALAPELHPSTANDDVMRRGTLIRCRRNIYESLAQYSMEALGVDENGIQAMTMASNDDAAPKIPPSGLRYCSIRRVVDEAISTMESVPDDTNQSTKGIEVELEGYSEDEVVDSDVSESLVSLTSNLLKYEEQILGSSLWQKRGKVRTVNKKKIIPGHAPIDSSQIGALPSSTSVQQIYNENRCTATSLALLLCFEGKPLELLSDLAGDIANESPEPLLRAFTVQAWLNAARSTLTELVVTYSSSSGLEDILLDVREWRFRLDSPDNMYLALSCFALLIPDVLGVYGDHSPYVNEICEEVWNGYKEHEFENPDIAKLCLGFIGVCAVRSRSMERLDEIVETLEKSVTGYGGQATFGALYGLAIIAQSCPVLFEEREDDDDVGPHDDLGFIGRIVGFLINELVLCISGNHNALASLVACVKNGEISPEIIDSLTLLGKKPLSMVRSKRQAAKSLFISFALCLPALTSVNDELLLGVYCLFESLPWGSGKGIALPSVLHACRRSGLFENREIENIYSKYAKVFEEGMDKGVDGLDDIFYAVTATMTKTIPYSIRRFLVGNRTLFDEDGRAVSLLAAVVSLSSLPCLGCGTQSFTDCAQLSRAASSEDIGGIKTLISEATAGRDWGKYTQVAVLLMGFLASMNNFAELGDPSSRERSTFSISGHAKDDVQLSQLPTALQGTILEVVMAVLAQRCYEPNFDTDKKATLVVVKLLGCLEVLSLPGHFSSFLEQMFRGNDEMKTACSKLLISQIRGRPRAVFSGREYIDLALRISKMPVAMLRSLLGLGGAPRIFIESLSDMIPKFSSESVEEVAENVWRLCINQVGQFPGLTVSFLSSMKTLLQKGGDKKSLSVSAKTLDSLRRFLLTRVFAGIRDAPWTTATSSAEEEQSIIEMYAGCLMEVPIASLIDGEFFTLKELDGFIGEALRNRCVMILVRQGYFTTPSRASSEIASTIAWFSRQLVSSEDEIFSSTLLQVACSMAEATLAENADRKRELLLTLLDNLLLTGSSASFVGLQMLSALVYQWCKGAGSDGDLSLACLCATQMERWQELSPPTLQQLFRLLVHDLPFNLASYARKEKLSGVVFNRLWRVYNKWWEQGADQETIDCVRKALICCRSSESGGADFASLATSMLV